MSRFPNPQIEEAKSNDDWNDEDYGENWNFLPGFSKKRIQRRNDQLDQTDPRQHDSKGIDWFSAAYFDL